MVRDLGPLVGAIDQGTSSSRFLVFAENSGELITYHQIEMKKICVKEGWLRLLDIDVNSIKAVGLCNQRETTVVWDKKTGKPLHNAIVWLDNRTKLTLKAITGEQLLTYPWDKDALLKYNEFAELIDIEEDYKGPRLDDKITPELMKDVKKAFKEGKKLHRKYAYKIILVVEHNVCGPYECNVLHSSKHSFTDSKNVVRANSVLLAASCPYFKTLLFGHADCKDEAEGRNITNKTVNLVNFNEESKRFFLLFLKYVYKGDIDIGSLSEDELIGVYSLSREFKFPELAHILSNALSSVFLCVENVGKIFDMAKRYDLRDLLKRCIPFAEINSTKILSNDDLRVKLPYQLVDELFKSDTFYVNEEVQLFIALDKWSKSNSTVDPSCALDSIRLEHIDAKCFGIHCKNSDLSDVDKWFEVHASESKRPK
ncbi:hypothetical protein B4U79_15034, partial [Dinothrombium tinctorium]